MRLPRVSRRVGVILGAGFATGLVVALLAFLVFAPGSARPTFVTHLLWRLNPPRVGIQAGHSQTYNAPDELSALRASIGAYQGDWDEWIINEDIARRVGTILRRNGVTVDLLPTTVPIHYEADVFVALHGDVAQDDTLSGFKATRGEWATSKLRDDTLVADLVEEYVTGTGLPEHRATISDNMMEYYAFNYKKYEHSVDPSTPAAILEMGFLSNDGDRKLLQQQPDRIASAIAAGVMRFLESR